MAKPLKMIVDVLNNTTQIVEYNDEEFEQYMAEQQELNNELETK